MKKLFLTSLIVYLAVLLFLTLFSAEYSSYSSFNFHPFESIRSYLKVGGRYFSINFTGNVLAFLPLGILLPLNFLKMQSFFKLALLATCLSFAIELAQYLYLDRVADVDDIILNVAGALIGFLVWKILLFNFRKL